MSSRPTPEYGAPDLPITSTADEYQDQAAAERCRKCTARFDPSDIRFIDSRRRHADSPFCRACLDRCQDSELADHFCMVDRWFTDNRV